MKTIHKHRWELFKIGAFFILLRLRDPPQNKIPYSMAIQTNNNRSISVETLCKGISCLRYCFMEYGVLVK